MAMYSKFSFITKKLPEFYGTQRFITMSTFSNPIYLRSVLPYVTDPVLHPHKITGKIIVLHILSFIFLGSNGETKDCGQNYNRHSRYFMFCLISSCLN
jgi:hypothetical protein